MDGKNSFPHPELMCAPNKSTKEDAYSKRQDFWNGTLVDDYNFLMSEELICRCRGSLGDPFTSLNDLSVHHVSYNEFEKQYGELSRWCEKIYETITKISSNALTRYLRQKYYEELYEQGLMRVRLFGQYAEKLIQRFPDLQSNIGETILKINRQWSSLESRFIDYLDEDFDRILQDLHSELLLFEEWLTRTEEQLWKFESGRGDDISIEDFQFKLHQHTKLQDDIKSRNSRVSSIIEICERLNNDYDQQAEQVPCNLASDLENRWHQTWLHSVEIQCKLEERLKILQNTTTSLPSIERAGDDDDDDIIPFSSSEYEKIPLTPSNSSIDSLSSPINQHRKRAHSSSIRTSTHSSLSESIYLQQTMAKSERHMSLNLLSNPSPSIFYYSLTNIHDFDEQHRSKKYKKTISKLDVGYESEDDPAHPSDKQIQPIFSIKKSHSDYYVGHKLPEICSSLTHSLPLFKHNQFLPNWWRHSITSAYDTCSNPDIDLSLGETKKTQAKTSLLMYSKKYTKVKRIKVPSQASSVVPSAKKKTSLNPTSTSYDASAEYTDPEQSENDVDMLSSDFNSASPTHQYPQSECQFYNRYTTTTTTGYSSDVELATTTSISETEDQQTPHSGEVSQMKIDTLTSPLSIASDAFDTFNAMISHEKVEGSEPCWDGYQHPLYYPFNSHDMDSVETTLKWEDQFLEMDQPKNSSSDDDNHPHDNTNYFLRNIDGSSSSLTPGPAGLVQNKQALDSDSDLDDFNYVLNETEKQLFKARQSIERKKRQQPLSSFNDRHLRKYDEVVRTCETNIQCLQQILKNLHRSKNSRLNSTQAIEQLQKYLSGWHDMRQQVNDDRIRARHLLYLSQEIVKLKLRIEDDIARTQSNSTHLWFDDISLIELMSRINYEFEGEKDSRQKLASYRTDILQAEEHLNEYRMSHLDGPSSSNIDEHLHSSRLALEQLTDKIETYQNQLRVLAKMIDSLIPLERQIEQKLDTYEYNNNYQLELPSMQRLLDQYNQLLITIDRPMQPRNDLHAKLRSYAQCKFDLYRKLLNEYIPKTQSKHVSFDGLINWNNNNSSRINTTSSSSSSTPQPYSNESHQKRPFSNEHRRTHAQNMSDEQQPTHSSFDEASNKQSSTSSYISDDCKVLYIETVIEVAKPVFYERTSDTTTTNHTNTETYQHHSSRPTPQSTDDTQRSFSHVYTTHQRARESSDEELSKPVNPTRLTRRQETKKIQHVDSGIEYDQASPPPSSSSSSTTFNQRTINNHGQHKRILFPPVPSYNPSLDKTSLVHRLQSSAVTPDTFPLNSTIPSTADLYWTRLRQSWLRSLLLGLLILLILFVVYFSRLDTCSRTTMIRSVCRKIICVEHEGLPTL